MRKKRNDKSYRRKYKAEKRDSDNSNGNKKKYRITDNKNGGTFITWLSINQLIKRGHTLSVISDSGIEKTLLWKNISITRT